MNAYNLITPVLALIGWSLTVVLVMQLLGGTFDTRSCTTTCVQIIYYSAVLVATTGFIGGVIVSYQRNLPSIIGTIALGVLLLIFLTTMVIGHFG